ncbi:MAG: FkbM family methyltransferase, partial [Candidatus Methanomethylicia archaeon]
MNFMNIDCEGMDFDVLQSNDWDKFRPNVLLVEVIPAKNFAQLMSHPIN